MQSGSLDPTFPESVLLSDDHPSDPILLSLPLPHYIYFLGFLLETIISLVLGRELPPLRLPATNASIDPLGLLTLGIQSILPRFLVFLLDSEYGPGLSLGILGFDSGLKVLHCCFREIAGSRDGLVAYVLQMSSFRVPHPVLDMIQSLFSLILFKDPSEMCGLYFCRFAHQSGLFSLVDKSGFFVFL